MDNLAQDTAAWIWVGKFAIILILFIPATYFMVRGIQNATYKPKIAKPYFIKASILAVLLALAIAALFLFFGSGKSLGTTSVSEDGHRKIVEARPDPLPESAIVEEAKTKRDPYLQAVDKGPADAQAESKEYIKNALKRAKQRNATQRNAKGARK